jgi:hypothetical protein
VHTSSGARPAAFVWIVKGYYRPDWLPLRRPLVLLRVRVLRVPPACLTVRPLEPARGFVVLVPEVRERVLELARERVVEPARERVPVDARVRVPEAARVRVPEAARVRVPVEARVRVPVEVREPFFDADRVRVPERVFEPLVPPERARVVPDFARLPLVREVVEPDRDRVVVDLERERVRPLPPSLISC